VDETWVDFIDEKLEFIKLHQIAFDPIVCHG